MTNFEAATPDTGSEKPAPTFVDHYLVLENGVQQLAGDQDTLTAVVQDGHETFKNDEDHLTAFFKVGADATEAELVHPNPRPHRILHALADYLHKHSPRHTNKR
jgi:hypothetical protein